MEQSATYFEYTCPHCRHPGRWLIPVAENRPVESLQTLVNDLASTNASLGYEKGRLAADLNKIHGVNDLLRLCGPYAPRERTRTESDDLP